NLPDLPSQRLGVLKYVLAQLDWDSLNELVGEQDGQVQAWANDFEVTLPEPDWTNLYVSLVSGRVLANFDRELDSELVEPLRAVDAGRLRDLLLSMGHSATSAGWAVLRLQEIQRRGRITGHAWNRQFGHAADEDSEPMAAYEPHWVETNCLVGVLR